MQGYYNNSLETDMVLRKHEDGKIWLHTGDTGYIDEDGILYYSDRLKRMFISTCLATPYFTNVDLLFPQAG